MIDPMKMIVTCDRCGAVENYAPTISGYRDIPSDWCMMTHPTRTPVYFCPICAGVEAEEEGE